MRKKKERDGEREEFKITEIITVEFTWHRSIGRHTHTHMHSIYRSRRYDGISIVYIMLFGVLFLRSPQEWRREEKKWVNQRTLRRKYFSLFIYSNNFRCYLMRALTRYIISCDFVMYIQHNNSGWTCYTLRIWDNFSHAQFQQNRKEPQKGWVWGRCGENFAEEKMKKKFFFMCVATGRCKWNVNIGNDLNVYDDEWQRHAHTNFPPRMLA